MGKHKPEILYRNKENLARAAIVGSELQLRLESSSEWFRARAEEDNVSSLTAVSGIGKANAKKLTEAGYDSIQSIVDSSPKEIAENINVSEKVAGNIHAAAVNHG